MKHDTPDPALSQTMRDQAMMEVVYKIVHDLRGSVRAIAELPNWIEEDLQDVGVVLPEGPAQSFDLMRRHAEKLNMMLDQLSRYSKTGYRETERVSVRTCLERAIAALNLPSDMQVRARFDPAEIEMNPDALTSIFLILLGNAAEHNEGPVRIAVTRRLRDGYWDMMLRDNGAGFPDGKLEQVFDPMSKFSVAETGGAGMGLAILRRLADSYGGVVEALPPRTKRDGATIRLRLKQLHRD
ncbi:ATP-binding protein [Phaeobacter gallaeciensis]|uniref:histidine kinase n=1 Tax=Phaeobacter gallaeciensis TaxID=60890 RepID=A0AAC9Z7F1_9RHOB|nr:sensor histidine kinase [Phaeobacter gallaeciensis]AHD08484.1 Histidine kinase-, DNA gyrase B-, and HSP90-like ATPase [Phaeobacter gallaeciensis DSM 26640]ATE91750.1 Histidine kinase-, DNA gyrase B-, and HSP90-like ATPase [Phaeobacter gallaeciensis]ATE98426.1 Histidine kinase-, DNA gyrase B-, and HSP90-like ATPase [Phaeobacter gallaeciensis]ATF00366.1 Histidine kinase-, DNA gyrase B-, and HSP90-like ATPase [Phaeobacter gallaeciensis]ATF04798.1 Histidine kinase-, DNA gyrase B-, and HSP90-lik